MQLESWRWIVAEDFYVCVSDTCRNPIHHYKPERCQTCGSRVKKHTVDDTKSLKKLLGIPEPKAKK